MPKTWTTWFSSDQHFGHANVLGFCPNRKFKTIEDMNEKIISNWNRVVSPEDLCIFVGDVFFYYTKEKTIETLKRMNGRKILVRGNHDQIARKMMNVGFEICVEEMTMVISGQRVLISHYPFAIPKWKFNLKLWWGKVKKAIGMKHWYPEKHHTKRPVNRGQFLIHGHSHSTEKVNGRQIHVGVDAWDCKPVNVQEISNMIKEIEKNEKDNK
jgi:calcineurin-like phosphoesterase family protein